MLDKPRSPVIPRLGGLHEMPGQMFPCQLVRGTHERGINESNAFLLGWNQFGHHDLFPLGVRRDLNPGRLDHSQEL